MPKRGGGPSPQEFFEGLRHNQRTILNKVTPLGPGLVPRLRQTHIYFKNHRKVQSLRQTRSLLALRQVSLKDADVMEILKAHGT